MAGFNNKGSGSGGVAQLLAGSNISLSPTNGLGTVTVASTAGSAAVLPLSYNGHGPVNVVVLDSLTYNPAVGGYMYAEVPSTLHPLGADLPSIIFVNGSWVITQIVTVLTGTLTNPAKMFCYDQAANIVPFVPESLAILGTSPPPANPGNTPDGINAFQGMIRWATDGTNAYLWICTNSYDPITPVNAVWMSILGGPLTGDVITTPEGAATLVGTANVESIIRAQTLNQFNAATGNYPMGGNTLTGLALATTAGQAATFEQLPGVTTVTATGTFTPTVTGIYRVSALGGGGGGGGGGTAGSALSFQMGGGGGGQGESKSQLMTLVAGTAYICTIGAAGGIGAGGLLGGHAGTAGGAGGTTTFAGPTNLVAGGGGPGAGGLASTANTTTLGAFPGAYGNASGSSLTGAGSPAGNGGSNFLLSGILAVGLAAGGSVGEGCGGGGGGGGASTSLGGGAGRAASYTTNISSGGGAGGASATTAGVTATDAATTDYGAGGGGGGGAYGATAVGGGGGKGGPGVIIIIGPLV